MGRRLVYYDILDILSTERPQTKSKYPDFHPVQHRTIHGSRLSFEDEGRADLVRVRVMRAIQLRSLNLDTERCLDTRAESLGVSKGEDTAVVDLGLDERRRVKVSFRADLEDDLVVRSLVGRLRTSLDVAGYSVVVRGGVVFELVGCEKRDSVLGRTEANTSSVLVDLAGSDIVASLTTKEEAVVSNDRISGHSWALRKN